MKASPAVAAVALDQVCQRRIATRDPRITPDKPFRYVDISSVDNKLKRISSPRELLGSEAPSRARQEIRVGDVLVATTRPNLNAVALVPDELNGQIASTGFCVLRPSAELDRDYLFGFVQSEYFVQSLSDLVKGALYPAVTDTQVRAQKIPFPRLPEQRRIAAQLREQLAEVQRARLTVETQRDTYNLLVHMLLRESLTGVGCQRLLVGDCLKEVTEGIGERWAEFPVLGATRAGLALAKEPVGKNPGRYKPVRPGTVFYNPMRILLGSIAMVDDEDQPGITSPDYVAVRGVEGKLDPRWFYHWFRSVYGAEFIKSLTRGAVRERLMFKRLAPATITVPDWPTQLGVAAKLLEIKRAKVLLEQRLTEIERLPAALLRQAFPGAIQ